MPSSFLLWHPRRLHLTTTCLIQSLLDFIFLTLHHMSSEHLPEKFSPNQKRLYLLVLLLLFQILLLFGFHSDLQPTAYVKFPWNHFHIPYVLSVFFSRRHKINFCFTSTSTTSDFPFPCLIKPSVCHAQLFFITEL